MKGIKINKNMRNRLAVLIIVFMLGLIFWQAPIAVAKTLQQPIPDPSNDTVVLNVIIGPTSLPYTFGDLSGAAGYKFAGMAIEDYYLDKDPHDICGGIKFSDFLANIESTLGITLQDTYKIQGVCSDAYANPAFRVGEAKNYTSNHYLLAHIVSGVSEACYGYDQNDPTKTYPPTYLRIVRNRGGEFETDSFGNTAYMRLICSIKITKSDGTAVDIPLPTVSFEENGGSEVADISQVSGTTIDTEPVTTKSGCQFGGWYADQGLTTAVVFPYTVAGNITLYAKWTEESPAVFGDINGDKMVNIVDVMQGVNFALGNATPNTDQFTAADTNNDNVINIIDVMKIMNEALGSN